MAEALSLLLLHPSSVSMSRTSASRALVAVGASVFTLRGEAVAVLGCIRLFLSHPHKVFGYLRGNRLVATKASTLGSQAAVSETMPRLAMAG